jgi:hypothetical protein
MKDLRHAEDVLKGLLLSLGRPRKQIDTSRSKKLGAATVVPDDISLASEALHIDKRLAVRRTPARNAILRIAIRHWRQTCDGILQHSPHMRRHTPGSDPFCAYDTRRRTHHRPLHIQHTTVVQISNLGS